MFAVIDTTTLPVLKDQASGMCIYVTESLRGCIARGDALKYWNYVRWKYSRQENEAMEISSGEVQFTGTFMECCNFIAVCNLLGE